MEGLRFACQPGCTACCRATGFVYLTEDDLRRAAAWLKMSPSEFETRYVYRTRRRLRLRKPPGSQCPFLREDGCSIHPVKPTQCRAYPFWPELVSSRTAWRQAAKLCPGIGAGPIVPLSSVLRAAHEMREAYPALYGIRNRREP
ncbi:MAG: YkgJ family cysteine cluster protein [Bryobacterales bacterium]|nr:YkgJ family cysteine cluster protein [Bryobacteraceae bacterium]MDW8354117.1 YkgJ family cysteine cluster protein [Bryobacterales bacterium]